MMPLMRGSGDVSEIYKADFFPDSWSRVDQLDQKYGDASFSVGTVGVGFRVRTPCITLMMANL